jgi:hypothetical protein
MGNFVLRASHFLLHPFSPAPISHLSAPGEAKANSQMTPAASIPACPSNENDLSWLSLSDSNQAPENGRSELAWRCLEHVGPEETAREELAWIGLEDSTEPEPGRQPLI